MPTDNSEALWDAADVATWLKCSKSLVYKMAEAGELPCIRIGALLRFSPAEVRAFALARAHVSPRTILRLDRGGPR